jgi:methylglutaconyl-CoA hydratase
VLSSNAVVGLPETRLGILPGAGGTYRLPALIGIGRAKDLILTGRRVSGAEAYFLGIADRLVEVKEAEEEGKEGQDKILKEARERVLIEALRMALEICEGAPVAVRQALHAVGYAREEVENQAYEKVVKTEDRDEALRAFGAKEKPVFKGK